MKGVRSRFVCMIFDLMLVSREIRLTRIRRHFAIYFMPHRGSLSSKAARWQGLFRRVALFT
jgi:hypothetical protein